MDQSHRAVRLRSLDIMVVGDPPGNSAWSDILQSGRFRDILEPHVVKDVSEAVRRLPEHLWDAVVFAAEAGEPQTVASVRALHQAGPQTPVVVVTKPPYGDNGFGLELLDAGAHDYLRRSELEGDRLQRAILYARARQELETYDKESIRRRMEQEAMVREQDRLMRYRKAMVNQAAHALKTPVTPLRIRLATLLRLAESHDDARMMRGLEQAVLNVKRMEEAIQGLLDAAQHETMGLALRIQEERPDRMVESVVRDYQPVADKAGVRLEVMPQDADVVAGDRQRIEQVLSNLVDNAVRATPSGGRVEVRVKQGLHEVMFMIRDTGRGLTPQEQSVVFEGLADDPEALAGIGLSLFVCRSLVRAHGGRIGCTSAGLGEGSTFFFTVPLARYSPLPEGQDLDLPGVRVVQAMDLSG